MRNALLFGTLFLFPLCLSGCGANPDSLMKDYIASLNETADAINSGASDDEIKKLTDRKDELEKQLEKLDLSDKEGEALLERHKEELGKAMMKLLTASMSKGLKGAGAGGFPGMPNAPGGTGMPGLPGQ